MSINYTDEELIRILKRYARQLGRTPTTCDILTMGGPSRATFCRHFGKRWDNVIESAGLPPAERKSMHEKYIHRDTPSREEVIDAFTSFISDYDYMPMVSNYPDFYRIARKLFNSDAELVEACGFDSATIIANTEKERQRRIHMPIESGICRAVKKSMPGSGYSCEFIKKYMQGEYDE